MSAFDLAGAVVATPCAFMFWVTFFTYGPKPEATGEWCFNAFLYSLMFTGWAAYCIARCFGAHL